MMKRKRENGIIFFIYLFLALCLFIYIIYATGMTQNRTKKTLSDFADGWTAEGYQEKVNIRRIPLPDSTGRLKLTKTLPDTIMTGDLLNFNSHNVYFTLQIEEESPYSFYLGENFTGYGYGDSFHNIPLKEKMAGKMVTIMAQPAFSTESSGGFENVMIGTNREYYQLFLSLHGIPALFSLLITFFGMVVLTVRLGLFKWSQSYEYNLTALSVMMMMLGMWTLLETRIPQMLTGATIFIRTLDYILLWLVGYPMIVFINSLTKKQRRIYEWIAFVTTVLMIALNLGIHFILHIDMHDLTWIMHIAAIINLVLIWDMLRRNYKYCKQIRMDDNLQFFYIGAGAFAVGGTLDLILYNLSHRARQDTGVFLRLGLVIFMIMMFQQIMRWVSAEQKITGRTRFVNSLLQYSLSGDSTEDNINHMLQYLGDELKADRAFIFEDMWDGTFRNTYEWCRESVAEEKENLQKVPFAGLLDVWYREYEEVNHVVISDIEAYKEVHEPMYHLLKTHGIKTMVTGPLEVRGQYIGFFGVDNPPVEMIEEISEIIRLLAYFMAVAIRQRDEQQQLINYSYFDQMTGTKNRRAEQEFLEQRLAELPAYGFLMCDINGLKRINDHQGHEAGDTLICDVADVLIMVFGKDNVYRLGGDEFSAFGIWDTEEVFLEAIENVKQLLELKGRSASLGYVYRPEGDPDFESVKNKADALMYADKAAFYEAHPELNRRG